MLVRGNRRDQWRRFLPLRDSVRHHRRLAERTHVGRPSWLGESVHRRASSAGSSASSSPRSCWTGTFGPPPTCGRSSSWPCSSAPSCRCSSASSSTSSCARGSRGSRRFGPFLHPIATLKRKFAPLGRSRQIIGYARRRGLTKLRSMSPAKMATPEFARRLRLMLEDCGGMFVKFGQIASTRTDLLPEVLTTELAELQSSVRPVSADEVRVVIESELRATVEEEFASFDFEPLAAASIGQTHRAVLKSGERVVVKVQRPGIEEIVHRDAAVLRLIAGQIDRRVEGARQIGVKRLADELIASLVKRAQLHDGSGQRCRLPGEPARTSMASRLRSSTRRSPRAGCS